MDPLLSNRSTPWLVVPPSLFAVLPPSLEKNAYPPVRRAGGGRGQNTRWEVTPEAAGLCVYDIKMRQHYESPPEVVATVVRRWAPDFDAMASPINAICADYATLEQDVLSLPLEKRCIFVNPAYAAPGARNGAAGMGPALAKLVGGDVRSRGCTLIALLPMLSGSEWFEQHVDSAHEVHLISGELVFQNPFLDLATPHSGYLWDRSYALVAWRPGAHSTLSRRTIRADSCVCACASAAGACACCRATSRRRLDKRLSVACHTTASTTPATHPSGSCDALSSLS